VSEIDKEKFPTIALYAAGVIMALAIGAAAYSRYQAVQNPVDTSVIQEPVASFVDLKFFDQEDGSVAVKNAQTGAIVATLAKGEDAFIRAVIRGFVRDRTARKIDAETPFRLYRLVDTRLVIEDSATKKRVNLRGFGPTQQEAFARLIPASDPPK
jgi:putative photosynthetic complex assembly protein